MKFYTTNKCKHHTKSKYDPYLNVRGLVLRNPRIRYDLVWGVFTEEITFELKAE